MERKTFAVSAIKAAGSPDTPGEFEALVAVFNNIDGIGDRVLPGAFTRSLKERGLPPLVWSHQWDVPPIGVVNDASETDKGLLIKGRLFVGEGEDSPVARQVYTAMKATDGNGVAPLREFSFGYEVRSSSWVTENGDEIRELKDLELFEVGPTLVGMNPETQLLTVKATLEREIKSGRVLSAKNESRLRDAVAIITDVLAQVDEEKASPGELARRKAAEKKEPVDKLEPKPEEGEEARARIGALLLAKPRYEEGASR